MPRFTLPRLRAALLSLALAAAAAVPAAPSEKAQLVTSTVDPATLTFLLPYIEQNYAQFFPGTQTTRTQGGFTYRLYANGNAVGYDGTTLYAMGPVVNSPNVPVAVATIVDFCNTNPAACGSTIARSLVIGGLTREFLVYLPWKARTLAGKPPAVVNLHGSGQSGLTAMNHFGWPALADNEGMLLAFPSALVYCFNEDTNKDGVINAADQLQVEAKWASGALGAAGIRPLCSAAQLAALSQRDPAGFAASNHALANDVEFVRRVAAVMVADYGADTKRLYLSGFSGGGEMVHGLVSALSTTFAAAHMAAGTNTETPLARSARPMSVLYTTGAVGHGVELPVDRDLTVAPSVVPNFADRAVAITGTISLATQPHTFTGPLSISARNVSVYTYTTSTAQPASSNSLTMVVIAGLGHDYPPWLAPPVWQFLRDKSLP